MYEKYRYQSDWYYITGFGFVAGSPLALLVMISMAMSYPEVPAGVFFIVWIVIACAVLYPLQNMPASFHAETDSVTFSLLFRKIYIPYSSISSIEVTRHYAHAVIRGDIPHYVEELHIICNDTEYHFHVPMQIDMDKAAVHPETLQEQFQKGIFQRLYIYIESHRNA